MSGWQQYPSPAKPGEHLQKQILPIMGGGPKLRQTSSAFESHCFGVPVVGVPGGPGGVVGVLVGVVAVAVCVVGVAVVVAGGVVDCPVGVVAVEVGVVAVAVGVVVGPVGVVAVAVVVVGVAVCVVAVVNTGKQQSSVESKLGKVFLSQPSLTHTSSPKQS